MIAPGTNGAHGKCALQLVAMAPKKGIELRFLLNMMALIVTEIILRTKHAMLVPAQVLY